MSLLIYYAWIKYNDEEYDLVFTTEVSFWGLEFKERVEITKWVSRVSCRSVDPRLAQNLRKRLVLNIHQNTTILEWIGFTTRS